MRFSEGKHRSKRAIPHASHAISKSSEQYHTGVTMTFVSESASLYTLTRTRAHARCVNFVYSAWPEVGGAALGLSYVSAVVDEGWRGRIISKSRISLAGREIKTPHWCWLRST